MAVFEYAPPGDIDGDPSEVRERVLADLERLARFVEDYTDSATRQLRNAGMQEAVEHGAPAGKALEVFQVRRPKEEWLVDQLGARGEQFAHYLRMLLRAGREYDEDPDASVLPEAD